MGSILNFSAAHASTTGKANPDFHGGKKQVRPVEHGNHVKLSNKGAYDAAMFHYDRSRKKYSGPVHVKGAAGLRAHGKADTRNQYFMHRFDRSSAHFSGGGFLAPDSKDDPSLNPSWRPLINTRNKSPYMQKQLDPHRNVITGTHVQSTDMWKGSRKANSYARYNTSAGAGGGIDHLVPTRSGDAFVPTEESSEHRTHTHKTYQGEYSDHINFQGGQGGGHGGRARNSTVTFPPGGIKTQYNNNPDHVRFG
eukprot:g2005.t1